MRRDARRNTANGPNLPEEDGCQPGSDCLPHGKLVDLSAFEREIRPAIESVPLSRLQRATGLSLRYVSRIRRGEKTPHPRPGQAFLSVATEVET